MDESTFGWLIEYEQQLREAGYDEKTIAHLVLEAVKSEMYRVNSAFYLIASPAFQDKAVREKLQTDMKQACEKYKAIQEK